MIKLHLSFSFHYVLAGPVLADPFTIAVTNSKAKVNHVGIEDGWSFFVDQLEGEVDVSLFENDGGSITCHF